MRALSWILALAALWLAAACEWPRDAAGTTRRVSGGELRVGAVHQPPWVIVEGGEPAGIEPRLVVEFAESMSARVRWIVGSEDQLARALEAREIDLLVGGLLAQTPHGGRIGLTSPYAEVAVVVAGPPGAGSGSVEGELVAVPRDRPALLGLVRGEGGEPRVEAAPWSTSGLAAGYAPELAERGHNVVVTTLGEEQHVIGVAPGESRFASRLERFLDDRGAWVTDELRAGAQEQ